jgi:hypothetical protein
MFILRDLWYNKRTMEFISISKKHSLWSSLAHVFLNIILVVAIWLSILITKTPIIAIALVIASKWRTLAVRPRYWVANFKSNLVDLIFSLGMTILIWAGINFWVTSVVLSAIYIAWLIVIKPSQHKIMIKAQALISIFFGWMALLSVGYALPTELIVFCGFVMGYATLRHILTANEFKNAEILSLSWGLLIAELTWVMNFLVIGYEITLGDSFSLTLPQASIILVTVNFLGFELLEAFRKEKPKMADILPSLLFSFLVCFVLIVLFSKIQVN